MPQFDIFKLHELHDYLYMSAVHDSRFKDIGYDPSQHVVKMILFNQILEKVISISFLNVKLLLSISDDKWGSDQSISSLTIEDIEQATDIFPKVDKRDLDGCIYLLFQLFSGNEIHIISKYVSFDEM